MEFTLLGVWCFFLIGVFSLCLILFYSKSESSRESISSFECGFDSKHLGRLSYSIRFLTFVVLFLFFDFELMLLLLLPNLLGLSLAGFSILVVFVFGTFVLEEGDLAWD